MRRFYASAVMLAAMICNGLYAATPTAKKAKNKGALTVFASKNFPFSLGKYTLKHQPPPSDNNAYALKQLQITSTGKKRGNIQQNPLYPVFLSNEASPDQLECLFLLPSGSFNWLEQHKNSLLVSLKNAGPSNNWTRYNILSSELNTPIEFVADKNKFAEIKSQWQAEIKHKLSTELRLYEDAEMEVLLYMRLFNSVPNITPKNWKYDDFARFIFSISGLRDIRDAIPLTKNNKPVMEAQTELPPKPLVLPQVKVEKSVETNGLSRWAPRSCYYVSWQNISDLKKTLFGFAALFDKWSTGTYPLSAKQIAQKYLDKIGILDKTYFTANLKDNVKSIALAGWDPYFQSGSSILVLIKTKKPVTALPAAPYVSSPEKNIIVLSTSKKLYKMALSSYKRERSLAQINNFAYSRQRIKAGKSEHELGFIYLSDYWLMNFISPRWHILSNRLARLDARIRLVYLLKICRMYETAQATLPSLAELKADPLMSEEFKQWLFAGMEEKNGTIRDNELGGLYDHPPIDKLAFEKVTKSEFKRYEQFKQRYSRRWKQIDPIAFQLTENKEGIYKTRLYISPISNRSDFRQISNFVSPQKPCHAFEKIPGKALGLSIAVPTSPLKAYGIKAALPLTIFIQLAAFDFAPSSYAPATWLEPQRKYDLMSYMRIPAAIALPGVASNAASMMMGRLNFRPSPYKGIEMMEQLQFSQMFPTMRLNRSSDGIQYFGVDPSTLIRIRDNATGQFERDAVPCDIRLSVDFIQGYQLRRKLWFEALKNRASANWRRQCRIFRIAQLFSQNKTNSNNDRLWFNMLQERHVFPTKNMVAEESLVRQIPPLMNAPQPKYCSSSNIIEEAKKLPELLLELDKIDAFISIEPNAVFFESHFKFAAPPAEQSSTSPDQERRTTPSPETKPSTLDFDE